MRYARRRHLAGAASPVRLAQHEREAHRERGSLMAGRCPASLEATTALRIPTTPWTLCGFSSCGHQELGAWGRADGGCADPLPLVPNACHPDQQGTGSNPGPPACKLAAESVFGIAGDLRDAAGGMHARQVLGSLPYFCGVRAIQPASLSGHGPVLSIGARLRALQAPPATKTRPHVRPGLRWCQ